MNAFSPLALAAAGLAAGAPLALAAVGGLFTELAGSLSVALEGCMTIGAFAAAAVAGGASQAGASPAAATALGLAAGLLAGLLLALLVGLAAERFGADVFVAGLAANLLAPGLASLLSGSLFGTKGVVQAPALLLGGAAPGAGWSPLASLAEPGFLLALGSALLLALLLGGTVTGLRIRAAGDRGEAAAAAGLDRAGLRLLAQLLAGAAAGLAGALLAARISAFVPGMSSGRGWIALVAIYLGGRRAGGVLLASLGFGLLIALSNAAQAFAGLPAELILALPYLATALALVLGRGAGRLRARV